MINAYLLPFGGLLLLGGRIADLIGRRRVLIAGLATLTAASVVAGLAWTPAVLLAARAAQGIGAALLAPAALSIVVTLFSAAAKRGRALGVIGAVSGAGGAAGVLASGVLTDSFGWPSIFLLTAALGAIALGLTPRILWPSRGTASPSGPM